MRGGQADLERALEILEGSGVVVLPTETVYGLAARLDRPEAIARIFELKGRPRHHVLQVLVADADSLDRLGRPSEEARRAARRFWPGPLTLVVPAAVGLPEGVVRDGTVGIRVPATPLALEIVRRAGPLAATSANPSGQPTPPELRDIIALFGDRVDCYLEGGRIEGEASTVVDTTATPPRVVRSGRLAPDEVLAVLKAEE